MEITDELVRLVAAELKKRLVPEVAAESRPRLLLAGGAEGLSAATLSELQKYFQVVRDAADLASPPEAEAVLVTRLSLQALVRVAAGDEGCTQEGRALLTALLRGRPAAVLKSGLVWRRFQETAPRPLLDRYVRCEDLLVSYGVRLVDEGGIVAALTGRRGGSPLAAISTGPPAAGRNRRRVLTEAEIRALCPAGQAPGQTLRLSPGDILTPLARDYAQSLKIDLQYG